MIEINLISPELRKKKKSGLLGGMQIPLEIVVGSAGGLFVLLIFVHISLLVINVMKLGAHKRLEGQWTKILPDKTKADGVIGKMRQLKNKQTALVKAIQPSDISWAQKLNLVSDLLPRGVWLSKVALNNYIFYLDGSAISRVNNEMINVHTFTSNLKSNAAFMKSFVELDVGSIQTRTVDKTNVADFLITLKLEGYQEDDEH